MMLQIDRARQLVDELLDKGWICLGHQTFDNHTYYLSGPYPIAIGQNIRLNPKKSVAENIDSYFKNIMSRMTKYGVKKFIVFVSKSGIPIPQYFKDFCNTNGIVIEMISDEENMENVINKLQL